MEFMGEPRQSSEWTYFIHYLRNTLGTLGSLADYYMTYTPNAEQVQRLLTQVKRLSDQSNQYIVAFSELTNPIQLQPRRLFLTDWLPERVAALKISSQKAIKVEFSLPKEPLEVMADPLILGKAVDAFMDNALDAMPNGGGLKISARQEGAKIIASFSNTGEPISPTIMPDLGKPFLTLKPGRMGLGLGWAKLAAQAHGGDFNASNQPGGIEFSLRLPTPPQAKP